MNEERILDKLDGLETKTTAVLVEIARLQEQMRDVPEIKVRVNSLEKWRWSTMGALAASGASLGAQLYSAMKGG